MRIVFREAAGSDVVLQELMGKVLVHLSCLVGVYGVSTSLVQICWEKIIVNTAAVSCLKVLDPNIRFTFHKCFKLLQGD